MICKMKIEVGANLQNNFLEVTKMNEKTKKVVAGIVLGTFTFGCATPVFAADNTMNVTSTREDVALNSQYVNDMPLIHANGEMETYGLKGITVKALKELIDANWTKITTFLIDINVELDLIYKLNEMKSTFFMLIDVYADVSDTAHEVIRNSLVGLGFNATVASVMADAICLIIF